MPNATSYASGEVEIPFWTFCFPVGLESVVGETGVTYISIWLNNNGYSLVIIIQGGPKNQLYMELL